jgi:L-ascorbate metabolism protein UlaG (beta-lactamase superfamily)
MLPIGDFFTMGPMEAAKAVELLGVKHVVPMHYGTFPLLVGTPQGLRDELAKRGITDVVVEELQPGDTLS